MRVILVTGMSGSGKSIALHVLEDAGYAVVDNLPARFVPEVVRELGERDGKRIALSVDIRAGIESIADIPPLLTALRRAGHEVRLLFLTANAHTLVQRYSETRRRHPLSREGSERTLEECIEEERMLLGSLFGLGAMIDTSGLPAQTLRSWVRDFLGADHDDLTLLFESFAYKHGVPLDADLVFDVRCLPNPYYDPALRSLTGRDAPVAATLAKSEEVERMISDIGGFISHWLPAYVRDNRSYLTVALGCTGGQHRSVYCVERLVQRFRAEQPVLVRHRALDAKALASAA